jgi:hypothetical protein
MHRFMDYSKSAGYFANGLLFDFFAVHARLFADVYDSMRKLGEYPLTDSRNF